MNKFRKEITRYILITDHPDGGSKARLFIDRGFNPAECRTFASAIRDHASGHPVTSRQEPSFGTNIYSRKCFRNTDRKKDLDKICMDD